jgi:hypothetical protein
MKRVYVITGGIYGGADGTGLYRSTSVSVDTETASEGRERVSAWAKKNFADWNHIDVNCNAAGALLADVIPGRALVPFVSHRK